MSKKDFQSDLDNLFIDKTSDNKNFESKNADENKKVRATFIVNKQQLEIIKALAYWERKQIKEIVFEAFEILIKTKNLKNS